MVLEKQMVVYAICDIRKPDRFRYVGLTAGNRGLKGRINAHVSTAQRGHEADLYKWMRAIGRHNTAFLILEEVHGTMSDLRAAERRWIERMIREGHDLFNVRNVPSNALGDQIGGRPRITPASGPEAAKWPLSKRVATWLGRKAAGVTRLGKIAG